MTDVPNYNLSKKILRGLNQENKLKFTNLRDHIY